MATFNAFAQTPAALAALASAPCATGKGIKALNTNKDGQVSRDKLKAYRQAHKGEAKGNK